MISTRRVVEIQRQVNQELDLNQLAALLIEAADGLLETYLKRTATYNRLYGALSEIIDRMVAADPGPLLKDFMHHEHPIVFRLATGKYYWHFDEKAAEDTVRAIADANPETSLLGKEAREAIQTFEFHRKNGSTPSEVAAKTTVGQPSASPPKLEVLPVLRTIDRHQLQTIVAEAGCDVLLPLLKDLAWPSLRLRRTRMDADTLPLGASKLGGAPDMPLTEEWPRFRLNPLSFIGQINLLEIAQYREFTHLPSDGQLLFFYEADLQPWTEEDIEPGSSRVLYLKPGSPLVRRSAPSDLYDELQYHPASLEFFEDMTLPGFDIGPLSEDPGVQLPDLSDAQTEALERLVEALSEYQDGDNQPKHRIFGFPDGWQSSMHIAWEYERGGTATADDCFRMLLQVDSDEESTEEGSTGMFWGSEGMIYFWIKRAELIQANFGNPAVVLECT